ncbi:MAG: polysaccharide deacetylase family protein [Verrucomicrobiales bacterium]|nr:polysaccharide deacetylase family protein [Verrucomicrobiales bacterium]
MTRAEFLKLIAAGALGVSAWPRLVTRGFTQPLTVSGAAPGDTAGPLWPPVPPLSAEPPSPPRFASSGPGLGNRIAITFDDGPTPGVTEKVLRELDRRNISATFFMIGRNAERHPGLAREVAAAGHEIANHTYTHPPLSALPAARASHEIRQAQDVITAATGRAPKWLRPPYGAFHRKAQGPLARSLGLGVVYWSVDSRDWTRPGVNQIINRVVSATVPGSIILNHDLHFQTAQAVGAMLDRLLEKDFNFTRVSGFLGEPYGPYQAS